MTQLVECLENRRLFAVNLLANGDFEIPQIGTGASGQGYTDYVSGQFLGSGWKLTSGSADVVSNAPGTTFSSKPASGKQYVDMNGTAPATLTQDATTVTGRRYLLRFAWTATPFVGFGSPNVRSMDVRFGGATVATVSKNVIGETPTNPGWTYSEYLVYAPSTKTSVSFVSKIVGSSGMALDNVSLIEYPFGTASISGQVFADGNGDGIKGTDSIGLKAWQVYIDTNNNGKRDANEIITSTDRFGNFKISNLAAGTYKLRVIQQVDWKLTTPPVLSITLTIGQTVAKKLFGEQPI